MDFSISSDPGANKAATTTDAQSPPPKLKLEKGLSPNGHAPKTFDARGLSNIFEDASKPLDAPKSISARNPMTGASQHVDLADHRAVPGGQIADVTSLDGKVSTGLVAIKDTGNSSWTLMPKDLKAAMNAAPPPNPAPVPVADQETIDNDARNAARGQAAHEIQTRLGDHRLDERVRALVELVEGLPPDNQVNGADLRIEIQNQDVINQQMLQNDGENPAQALVDFRDDIAALLTPSDNQLGGVIQAWTTVTANPPPATDPASDSN